MSSIFEDLMPRMYSKLESSITTPTVDNVKEGKVEKVEEVKE